MRIKLKIFLLSLTIIFFVSCEDKITPELGTTFFAFGVEQYEFGVEQNSQSTHSPQLYSAFVTSSDRTIDLYVNFDETTITPDSYTIPTSVVIPANSNYVDIPITIEDVNLNIGETEKLVIMFDGVEGEYSGDKLVINVNEVCADGFTNFRLDLTLDSWPEETYWEVLDSSGNIVFQSTDSHLPYAGAYTGQSGTVSYRNCITAGNYELRVQDDYGDGGASYEVFLEDTSTLTIAGNSYSSGTTVNFTVQ